MNLFKRCEFANENTVMLILCMMWLPVYSQSDSTKLHSMTENKKHQHRDIASFGFGLGQDYGGIGINLTVFPHKNAGLFASAGYAFAGTAYNAGIKLRAIPESKYLSVSPVVMAMYGYYAAIKVVNKTDLNKIFYGPTAGGGLNFKGTQNKGYFSIAVMVPFRDDEVDGYIDFLKKPIR